jgi:carotene epsilon-monooxygenase
MCLPVVLAQLPFLAPLIPRQRKAVEAVELIRTTTNDLIKKCKEMVDDEEMAAMAAASAAGEDYLNKGEWVGGELLLAA